MASVLLHAPQDFHNLCLLARTLEAFGYRHCLVFDPHRLVRERYGKMRSREMRAVSAGAFEKIAWVRVEDPAELFSAHAGRIVATAATPGARPLSEHRFEATDLVVFGSESRGLGPDVLRASQVTLTIPLHGQTQSLNLAVSVGIVLFEIQRQGSSR
jgi:tRNA G18 (ribose-2'-O)-methylase SpoU